MAGCACVYVGYEGEGEEFFQDEIRTARKPHICIECGREIAQGETYEYNKGVWYGRFETHKTCSDCLSVRKAFFCDGWIYGEVWQRLREHIEEGGEDLDLCCINGLTPLAADGIENILNRLECC